MNIPYEWLHPASLKEATIIQRLLANKVRLEDDHNTIHLIGGMDVSNNRFDPKKMIYAACINLDSNKKTLQEQTSYKEQQLFPYISGYLGFREAPALVKAFNQLSKKPDIILVDGHGISHPRRLGIASHIGVLLDIPTIGVAKNILVGSPQDLLGSKVGDRTPLIWKNQQIGMVLRTKLRCNPLIISAGHRVTLETAIDIVLNNLNGYRLPETTRHAHLAANHCRKLKCQF